MLHNKIIVLILLVAAGQVNCMQYITKKVTEKFVVNPKNVGFWTTLILASIPSVTDITKLWYLKKNKEKQTKRWYPIVGQESNYFKRAKFSPKVKKYLTKNGIEVNRIHTLRDSEYKKFNALTPDGKIVLSQDYIVSIENVAHKIKSDEICTDIFKFFDIKKSQQYWNNNSFEKQIERNPVAYFGGVLVAQTILKPLSLIKKASSLSKTSYLYNGIKGYFKASLLSQSGWIGKYIYAKHEEKKSYDIDFEPVAKDNLLEIAKKEYQETAELHQDHVGNEIVNKAAYDYIKFNAYVTHSITQNNPIFCHKIHLDPNEIISTIEKHQKENKKKNKYH